MSNIIRWLFSSISKHFDETLKNRNIPLRIEGQPSKVDENTEYFAELRLSGPTYRRLSRQNHRFDLVVNILVIAKRMSDTHKIYEICDAVLDAFNECIEIKKYGNRIVDNENESIGILRQTKDQSGSLVTVVHLGMVDKSLMIQQSTVESSYRLTLKTLV